MGILIADGPLLQTLTTTKLTTTKLLTHEKIALRQTTENPHQRPRLSHFLEPLRLQFPQLQTVRKLPQRNHAVLKRLQRKMPSREKNQPPPPARKSGSRRAEKGKRLRRMERIKPRQRRKERMSPK